MEGWMHEADGWMDWLSDRLAIRPTGYTTDLLSDRLAIRAAGAPSDWLAHRLAIRPTGYPTDWLFDWPAIQLSGYPTERLDRVAIRPQVLACICFPRHLRCCCALI